MQTSAYTHEKSMSMPLKRNEEFWRRGDGEMSETGQMVMAREEEKKFTYKEGS